jgi:hypothetical protein
LIWQSLRQRLSENASSCCGFEKRFGTISKMSRVGRKQQWHKMPIVKPRAVGGVDVSLVRYKSPTAGKSAFRKSAKEAEAIHHAEGEAITLDAFTEPELVRPITSAPSAHFTRNRIVVKRRRIAFGLSW